MYAEIRVKYPMLSIFNMYLVIIDEDRNLTFEESTASSSARSVQYYVGQISNSLEKFLQFKIAAKLLFKKINKIY